MRAETVTRRRVAVGKEDGRRGAQPRGAAEQYDHASNSRWPRPWASLSRAVRLTATRANSGLSAELLDDRAPARRQDGRSHGWRCGCGRRLGLVLAQPIVQAPRDGRRLDPRRVERRLAVAPEALRHPRTVARLGVRQHQGGVARLGRVPRRRPALAPRQHRRPASPLDEALEPPLQRARERRLEPLALEGRPVVVEARQQLASTDRHTGELILEGPSAPTWAARRAAGGCRGRERWYYQSLRIGYEGPLVRGHDSSGHDTGSGPFRAGPLVPGRARGPL